MLPDSKQFYFPVGCQKCGHNGYLLIDDYEGSYYVICKKCGGETAQVWCDDCQSGGEYIRHVEKHPDKWTCSLCSAEHTVPAGFYETPTYIVSKEELPLSVQQKIELDKARQPKKSPIFIILIVVVWLLVFPLKVYPREFTNWLATIFHQNYDTVWNFLTVGIPLSIFSMIILSLLILQWRNNKKMVLYWIGLVMLFVGSIWVFFILDDIVAFLQLPETMTSLFLSLWAMACCAQMFLMPVVFKKWRLAIDPEYAKRQKKKSKS